MGFFDKLKQGLSKTKNSFDEKMNNIFSTFRKADEELLEELEEALIMSDVGVVTSTKIIENLRNKIKKENLKEAEEVKEALREEIQEIFDATDKELNLKTHPSVILVVGVNGVGKTTTIAKLAYKFKNMDKSVMMVAGDTFRAGAVEQLKLWSERVGTDFYGKENIDPAGVIYDGIQKAIENNNDIVLVDTAGRLQNKVNLMNELEKINRVIGKLIPGAPHETLLVIDATTGQNGIMQATEFKKITNITGIVLTKLDSSSKGGIVLAIKENTNIPVKFIGLGEKMEDLDTFDIENYIYGLFKDML